MICEACKVKKQPYLFDYDHKLQKCFSGDNSTDNIQILCLDCHRIKTIIETTVIRPFQKDLSQLIKNLYEKNLFDMQSPEILSKSLMQYIIKDIDLKKGKQFLNANYKKRNKFVINKWLQNDEKKLVKLINNQQLLSNKMDWNFIHKRFNEVSKNKRSILSIKRKYKRLINSID